MLLRLTETMVTGSEITVPVILCPEPQKGKGGLGLAMCSDELPLKKLIFTVSYET